MKQFLDEKVNDGLAHYRKHNEVDRKLMMDLREIFSSDFQVKLFKNKITAANVTNSYIVYFLGRTTKAVSEGSQGEGETFQEENKGCGTGGYHRRQVKGS